MKVSTNPDKFLWLGNRVALDFVNTEVHPEGRIEELLQTPDDLLHWLTEAGLVKGKIAQIATELGDEELERALKGARDYRKQIRGGLAATGFRKSIPDTLVVRTNHLLAVPTRVGRLILDQRGGRKLASEWEFTTGEDLLRPIAAATAELLVDRDARRIRRCRNPDCILYFYDVSKSNTRAWCSLDICGNKSRAADFRKRHSRKS